MTNNINRTYCISVCGVGGGGGSSSARLLYLMVLDYWERERWWVGCAWWLGTVKPLGRKRLKRGIMFCKDVAVVESALCGMAAQGKGSHTLTSGRAPEDPNVLRGISRTSWA